MSRSFDEEYLMINNLLKVWSRGSHRDVPQGDVALHVRRFRVIAEAAIGPRLRHLNDIHAENLWFRGPPIKGHYTTLFPVASVSTMAGEEDLWVKLQVALFHQSKKSAVATLGWRFETPDKPSATIPDPAHPYNHSQSITGWWKGLRCLLHPHTSATTQSAACRDDSVVDELKPAFPLRGSSPPGLVFATIVALHGAPQTRKLMRTDRTIMASPVYGPEFRGILGDRGI